MNLWTDRVKFRGIDIHPQMLLKLEGEKINTITKLASLIKISSAEISSLAEKLEIDSTTLIEYINMARLLQIKGVGENVRKLLAWAGITTIESLANQDAEKLSLKLKETNRKKRILKTDSSPLSIQRWIKEAKELV